MVRRGEIDPSSLPPPPPPTWKKTPLASTTKKTPPASTGSMATVPGPEVNVMDDEDDQDSDHGVQMAAHGEIDPDLSAITTNNAIHATADPTSITASDPASITAMGSSMATLPDPESIVMDDEDEDNQDSEVVVMDDEDDQDQGSDHVKDKVARGEIDPPPSASTMNSAMHATAVIADSTALDSSMATVPNRRVIAMDDEDDHATAVIADSTALDSSMATVPNRRVIAMDDEDDQDDDSDSDSEVIVMDGEDDQDEDSDHVEDEVARGEIDPPPSASTANSAVHATAGTADITAMGSSMATVPDPEVIVMDDEDDQDSDSDSEVIVMDDEDDMDSDSDSEVIVMDGEDDPRGPGQ
jgi:hypothetical protein